MCWCRRHRYDGKRYRTGRRDGGLRCRNHDIEQSFVESGFNSIENSLDILVDSEKLTADEATAA